MNRRELLGGLSAGLVIGSMPRVGFANTSDEGSLESVLDTLNKGEVADNRDYISQLPGEVIYDLQKNIGSNEIAKHLGVRVGTGLSGDESFRSVYNLVSDDFTFQQCMKNNVHPYLLAGIVLKESGGHPFAISGTGAFGHFQLTKWVYGDNGGVVWRDREVRGWINPFDEKQAVNRVCDYLANDLRLRFKDDLNTILGRYTQGLDGKSLSPASKSYANRVIVNMKSFQDAFPDLNERYISYVFNS